VERAASRQASICVLPFVNISGDCEQEYFADGITEDIITDLSKVSALGVASRNSAFAYKGKTADIMQVARQLKVSHILEGSVRKAGNRVRITAQLIDGATNTHLWAERYDRDLSDIFALQDEISEAIVKALKLRLLPEEKKAIERRDTTNAEAYKLYLMARQYLLTTAERHRPLVVRLCEKAVELDPNFARAWALLALGRSNRRLLSGEPGDTGWDAANRALALEPNLAEAHAAKGRILADQGRFDEAVVEHEIAFRLDPESYDVNCAAARCYTAMRRYDDAIRHYERAARLVETEFWASGMVVQCYEAKGDVEGAKRASRKALERVERLLAAEPDHGVAMAFGVTSLVTLGEAERAREWTERALLLAPPDDLNTRYNLGCAMIRLGETDLALDLLEYIAPKMQREALLWWDKDTDLDGVRSHPRYERLREAADARLRPTA
jgi:adenylate cyclase